jgi:hypothetical protein
MTMTVAMTYDALAARLGISVASARRLVQRRRWTKSVGNDGRAVVMVPVEFLAERDNDKGRDAATGHEDIDPAVVTDPPTAAGTDLTTDLVARLTAVQAEMAEMARKLGTAEGELRATQAERDHLRELLDRQMMKPWWRRVVGA